MPWLGVSRHQKYFLQLVACGKKPSALHLNAGEKNLMPVVNNNKTDEAHLGRCWEWLVGPVWLTLVLEARDLQRSVQAEASVVEVVDGPPPAS